MIIITNILELLTEYYYIYIYLVPNNFSSYYMCILLYIIWDINADNTKTN